MQPARCCRLGGRTRCRPCDMSRRQASAGAVLSTMSTSLSTTSSIPRSVVSISMASSARPSGLVLRELSNRSRRRRSASTAATSAPGPNSFARRCARACADAVRNTFGRALGHTTEPISRPSTTMRPSPISNRCCATRSVRTPATAETALTAAVTWGERISASTRLPFRAVSSRSGSVVTSIRAPATTRMTRSASLTETPASRTARRGRAVHRARIEVAGAEAVRKAAGDRRFARS